VILPFSKISFIENFWNPNENNTLFHLKASTENRIA